MDATAEDLRRRKCRPCAPGTLPLPPEKTRALLSALPRWTIEDGRITRTFPFADYHRTMAFVNASAWISHAEDHHPDLLVEYNRCKVSYATHSVGGLSENDFICAAKLDALFEE